MESGSEADDRGEAGGPFRQRGSSHAGFQTPRPHNKNPDARAVGPYQIPSRMRVTPSPLTGVSSPGLSPYPPLSERQVKRLKEETRKTRSQIDLISDVVARVLGQLTEEETIVACLGAVLDEKLESRTFSALTSEDYLLLNPGESGLFMYNQEQLNRRISHTDIPIDFWPSLQTLRLTFSRRMEMGVRQIIGHFLAYAVKIAQSLFDDSKRLVVHSDVDFPAVDVPEIGRVRGPLDYLTCSAAGTLPMRKYTEKN